VIIVDANIWIDHLRSRDKHLVSLIEKDQAFVHPYTVAEVSLGSLRNREEVVRQLSLFQAPPLASHEDVMSIIEWNKLAGTGIGYVDCHLLTATLLMGGRLWTRDRRLSAQSAKMGICHQP